MNAKSIVMCGVLIGGLLAAAEITNAQEDIASPILLGLGGACTAAPDHPDVVWFNPAITAFATSRTAVSISYRRLFELAEMEEFVGSATVRIRSRIVVGGGVSHFGDPGLFEEIQANGSVAVIVHPHISLGVSTVYQRTEFGEGSAFYSGAQLSAGAAWQPKENVLAALAVRQIPIDNLYEDGNHKTAFDLSAAWSLPPDLTIAGRWFRESGESDRFGLGQILHLTDGLNLLTGLRFDPIQYSLGGQMIHRGFQFDYVYVGHPELGGTHTIGAAWMID